MLLFVNLFVRVLRAGSVPAKTPLCQVSPLLVILTGLEDALIKQAFLTAVPQDAIHAYRAVGGSATQDAKAKAEGPVTNAHHPAR